MAAAFVNKDELAPHRFGNAIAALIQLQAGRGLAGAGRATIRA